MTDYEIEAVKATPYMSIVEGRKPRQKVHTSIGHAKNAFDTPKVNKNIGTGYKYNPYVHTHGWGAIFEHKGGDWVLIYEIPQPKSEDYQEGKSYHETYETRPWKL